jgi:hypothetical protein
MRGARIEMPDPAKTLAVVKRAKRTMPARMAFVLGRFTQLCAEYLAERIKDALPSTPRWDRYSEALRVVQIATGRDSVAAYGVVAALPVRRITSADAPSALLYVRARPRKDITDPAVAVLQKYSPWTWDTIPVPPARGQTTVKVRTVRADEAEEVRALRLQQRREWSAELSAVGVNPQINRRKGVSAVDGTDDVAYTVMQAEMGMSSEVPPHWRPAIRALKRGGYRVILRDPLLRRALTDLSFVPPPLPAGITLSRAAQQQFAGFQAALSM